jgi:hypothetical protein
VAHLFEAGGARAVADLIERTRQSPFFASAVLIDDNWITLSRRTVRAAEEILLGFAAEADGEDVAEVPLADLIWPGKPVPGPQRHRLGGRVVVIAASGPAQFGTFATVVGGSGAQAELDLVADQESPLFSYLRKKLMTRRGLTLKKGDVFALPEE